MTVLRLSNLSLSYKDNPIISHASVALSEGTRTGIVGPNGSGKTSLLLAILNLIDRCSASVSGSIDWIKEPRVGYVPQVISIDPSRTPVELIGHHKVDVLGRHGIRKSLWDSPVKNLSGGEKTRLSLALAMSSDPDFLVLDEPTNHLDIPGIEWLERTLKDFPGTVLVVSHDRYFLDSVCKEIWELRDGKLTRYPGGYTSYRDILATQRATLTREYERWTEEARNLEREVANKRTWYDKAHKAAGKNDYLRRKAKKHARQFKAKEARLQKLMKEKPRIPIPETPLAIGISHAAYRTLTLVRARRISFSYPGGVPGLLQDVSFTVSPGQKIGLTGYNGSGKSTLLKLLTGELEPDAGELWMNPRAAIGYLSQMLSELKSDSCPAEAVRSNTGLSMPDARNLLGKMGISGDTQLQPLNTLSWGEKTRVAIACLTHSEYDALILDEPTNHLDMNARDATEEALGAFPGAIIVATHDRYFLDRLCDTIWYIHKGHLSIHNGNYASWLQESKRARQRRVQRDPNKEAERLAIQSNLAYLASRIATSKDASEIQDLERQYDAAVRQLEELGNPDAGDDYTGCSQRAHGLRFSGRSGCQSSTP
jgi:ATPase subunit of ABC transporter with duplicated ATPase domains